ncbi:hypothetical protein [Leucobacter chinensis]|uniref:hypothetical protein n=1 Tax=Leucobacter chinensis TaxID=2851010 RepID=UPI001C214E65|nr:hypothetical protein [Leucobacter chinensis]
MNIGRGIKVLVVTALASAFAITGVNAANATPIHDFEMPETVDESYFSGNSETGLAEAESEGIGAFNIATNPYNCWGRTPYVHLSGGTKMSGHADIYDCNAKPAYLEAIVGIYKEGWFNQWHFLGSNINSKVNQFGITTHFKRNCVDFSSQNYYSVGSFLVDIGGKHYTGSTTSVSNRFNCNVHAGPHQP